MIKFIYYKVNLQLSLRKSKLSNFYLAILAAIVLTACTGNENKIAELPKFAIIIVNNQNGYPIKITRDYSMSDVDYKEIITDNEADTFQIKFNNYAYLHVSNKLNYVDTTLIAYGDTIYINAKNNLINKKILGIDKQIKRFEDGFKTYKSKNSSQNKIDSLTALFYSVNYKVPPFEFNDDYAKSKKYLLKISKENFKLKKKELLELIETLKIQYKNDIDFLEKTNYNLNLIKLHKEKLQNTLFTKILILSNLSNEESILKFLSSDAFINDSLPNNTYGQSFLSFYLRKIIIKKPMEYSGGKDYVDYKEAFDNAPKYFKDDLLKYARFLSIKSMVSYDEPDREIKKRYVLFKKLYNDKRLISILDDTYLLNIDKEKISNTEIQLLTASGKKLNFTDLLKSLKGSLVYIDFWASWCAPCRAAMPSSLKLNEEYKNKGVAFIYLSVDKDLEKWKNASSIEKLNQKEHNYLVINQENELLKNINFNLIPRYLVFDQKGVLIFENAPGPEGDAIRRLFSNYLIY